MGSTWEIYEPTTLEVPVSGDFGQAVAAETGSMRDDELALLRVALLSRLPSRCPDDALDVLGPTFGLERYPADTNDTYRARLVQAWPTRMLAGADGAVIGQLTAFGIPDVLLMRDADGQFGPGAPGAYYSELWPFLGPNFGSTGIAPLLLGGFVLGPTTTLGTTATPAQITTIKKIILRWKATHGYPVRIFLVFGNAPAGPLLGVGFLPQPPEPFGLILGGFALGGDGSATVVSWIIGKTLGDTVGGLGGFTLGGYVIS
jgi:Phage tail protein (Tail_P2_I)